ncbi:hypothetical protein HKL94_00855 [Candidatus Parcubacteria bacterium]|nr:hypothetical protein [Candidatus Parcubacteria bacterium]
MTSSLLISEIQFVPIKPREGLVGFASFVLDGRYYVGSVAVYTRLSGIGYRLVYPAKKVGERSFNTFNPIDPVVGRAIEEKVSAKVYELLEERTEERSAR